MATGRAIVTLMNYGIHAESLGFNGGAARDGNDASLPTLEEEKYWLSADWPYFARKALEARFGGVGIQMAGAVGSVETPRVFAGGSVWASPTGQYDPGHPAGCRSIFATTGNSIALGYFSETREIGERVAAKVGDALQAGGIAATTNDIAFSRRRFFVPISNLLFVGAGLGQTFPRRPTYVAGVELPQASALAADPLAAILTYDEPSPNTGAFEVKTEVAAFTIGDAEFVSTPGEEFPIGYVRGFQGPEDMPFPNDAMTAWVTPRMTKRVRFIEGLGEDMIGYLFPKANAVGVPGERDLDLERAIAEQDPTAAVVGTDRFGCGHSDDSEAANGDAGNAVSAAALLALADLGSTTDRILPGRYLFAGDVKRRSPLGDGTLGCTGALKNFTPAATPPTGVIVRDGGTTRRITFAPAEAVGWIDYNGVDQSATPTVDTRGVRLADGLRLYVDVYPDVTF